MFYYVLHSSSLSEPSFFTLNSSSKLKPCIYIAEIRGRGGLRPCPTSTSPVCSKQKTCLFWCYALNYRPEKFFVSSFLCRKTLTLSTKGGCTSLFYFFSLLLKNISLCYWPTGSVFSMLSPAEQINKLILP